MPGGGGGGPVKSPPTRYPAGSFASPAFVGSLLSRLATEGRREERPRAEMGKGEKKAWVNEG